MIINSPSGTLQAFCRCPQVKLTLKRVDFTFSPIVLRTSGIDMILGLNWLNHYQANIKCHEKLVEVTAPSGDKLSVEVTMQPPLQHWLPKYKWVAPKLRMMAIR